MEQAEADLWESLLEELLEDSDYKKIFLVRELDFVFITLVTQGHALA